MEKWKRLVRYRGGEGVGKWVGKVGKVSGKVKVLHGDFRKNEFCTEFCTSFTGGFTQGFTRVFHNLRISHRFYP